MTRPANPSTPRRRPKNGRAVKVDKGIYQRGPVSYQVKIVVHGIEYTQTFDTLRDAQIWRDRKRMARYHDPDAITIQREVIRKREAPVITLASALKRYLAEETPAKKGASVERTRINKVLRYPIASLSMYSISPEDIEDFLGELASEGLSTSSLTRYYSLLSVVWRTAQKKWRKNIPNPFDRLQPPGNGQARKRRLEEGEEESLIAALRESNPQVLALVELAIETAARQGELLNLTWGDVSFYREDDEITHGVAILRHTKNGETRAAPLSRAACAALLRIMPDASPSPESHVFAISKAQLRSAWESARARAGCDDLRFHDLRHEAISRLFELGLDTIEVAQISGHKTISILSGYTHLRPTGLATKINRLKTTTTTRSTK